MRHGFSLSFFLFAPGAAVLKEVLRVYNIRVLLRWQILDFLPERRGSLP